MFSYSVMDNFGDFIRNKCLDFSVDIVNTYKSLCENKKEYVLSKQLLRSGTSIGANLVEAQNAISHKEFLAKVYISLKECAETSYWLELLFRTNYLSQTEFDKINNGCQELNRILNSITKTAKSN